MPAEYVLLLLSEAQGEAVELDFEHDRFLDAQTFVQLVSNSWIGTVGSDTSDLTSRLYASGFLDEDQPHTYAEEI